MADHMTAEQLREDLADKAQLYRSQALAMESLADDEIAEILDGFADVLEGIAARLSGMAADTWQPMETAPKDAEFLWLWVPDMGPQGEPYLGWWNGAEGWVCKGIYRETNLKPTHWRAAPEPPHV